jgi:oxygen-independent coproporphyrinogen-3 oxidase
MSEPLQIYIHIPFCPSKCPFCAFKTGVRHRSTIDSYIEKLCEEIAARLSKLEHPAVETIYLGGGTPNLLEHGQIKKILETLFQFGRRDTLSEMTVEIHPKLITPENTKTLLDLGFNRFSLGVQSFDDGELDFLRRGYTSQEVMGKIQILKDEGVKNLNLDFIIAIPGQTLDKIRCNLETALKYEPAHLSHYLLSYEEGTHLTKEKTKGRVEEMDEDQSAVLYEQVCNILEKEGYSHYEISNWSRPGYECRHNQQFWNGKPYWGFGLSSTSFYEGVYTRNTSSLQDYISNPLMIEEHLQSTTEEQKLADKIIRQTRTREGVESGIFSEEILKPLFDAKLLVIEENHLKLTRKGWLLNDYVVDQLLSGA